VSNIGKLWDGLRRATGTPVNFVLGTVYNNGIKRIWDWVADKIGASALPKATLLRFARGGVVPGYAPGQDTEHAILSPGEGVLVPEAVRGIARRMGTSAKDAIGSINASFAPRLGNAARRLPAAAASAANALVAPGEGVLAREAVKGLARQAGTTPDRAIRKINAAYSPRVRAASPLDTAPDLGGIPDPSGGQRQGFDLGGVFGWIVNKVTSGAKAVAGGVGNAIGAVKDAVAGVLRAPLTAAGGALKGIVHKVLPTKPPFTWMMRAMSDNLIDKATDWIAGKDDEMNAVAAGGGGMGWQQLWAIVHGQFPNAKLFSSYRPGAITSSGNQSYHASGRPSTSPPACRSSTGLRRTTATAANSSSPQPEPGRSRTGRSIYIRGRSAPTTSITSTGRDRP
jgi:hypothetical protein